jgi:hypothetical protein
VRTLPGKLFYAAGAPFLLHKKTTPKGGTKETTDPSIPIKAQ